jgi:hypothetical protein
MGKKEKSWNSLDGVLKECWKMLGRVLSITMIRFIGRSWGQPEKRV